MGTPLRVFISYSPRDAKLKDKLVEQLRVLGRFRDVTIWTDDEIPPGANRLDETDKAIAASDVALLLISASFLESKLTDDADLPTLLKRNVLAGLIVIPVILSDCLWQAHPAIGAFQVLPKDAVPVTKYTGNRRAKALKQVAEAIGALAKERLPPPSPELPALTNNVEERGAAPASRGDSQPMPLSPPRSAVHQLRSPPNDFVGREQELADLHSKVHSGGIHIVGLTGQGGAGKSALALRLAHDLRDRYPDAQIDIDLRGTDTEPIRAAQVMAEVIHAFEPEMTLPDELEARGRIYRSVLDRKRALLFFDNVRDRSQIEPLVPPSGCLLFITSRQHFTLPGLYARRLSTLTLTDAIALVRSIAPDLDERTAGELAELCGQLPLAVRTAASLLAERVDVKPAKYLKKLRSAERAKLVEAVVESSLELLDAPARELWLRLGLMPADFDATAAAAVGGIKVEDADEQLSELLRRSLLDWDNSAERYRMHGLAVDYSRARLDPIERHKAEMRHAQHFLKVAGAADDLYMEGGAATSAGLRAFDQEWAHIAAAQTWAAAHADQDDEAAGICCELPLSLVHILKLRCHPAERIEWIERAIAAAQRLDRPLDLAALLAGLGSAFRHLGKQHKAIELYERSLAIARELGDLQQESLTLEHLGIAYTELGESLKAITLFQQRLLVARELGDRRAEGNALGNIGSIYTALGKLHQSIELFNQSLVIHRELGNRRGEGTTLGNLGAAHACLGELDKAIVRYEQHLSIARELGDRRVEAITSWNLGDAYEKIGDLRRAIDTMQVRIDYERAIGHPALAQHEAHVELLRARLDK